MKIVVFMLALTMSVLAQTAPRTLKHITWSEKPECGERRTVPETDIVECDLIITNGRRVSILEHNGMQIAAVYGDDGDHIAINTLFVNRTGKRILIEPERFVVLHFKNEADHLAGKTMAVEPAVDPNDIAKKIKRGAMWANVFTALGAAYQTRESTLEARTNTGLVITGTERSPDYAAQNRAAAANAQRASDAQQRASAVKEGALYANTVFDKQMVGGYVYFKRNKKAEYTQIGLILEGSVYIFEIRKEPKD